MTTKRKPRSLIVSEHLHQSAGQPLVPLVRCKVDGKLRPLAARKSAKRKARK